MSVKYKTGDEQKKMWNGSAGQAWAESQELLNQMFQPFEEMLVQPVPAGSEGRLLDVGCGTGSITLAAARRLGAQGRCTGIDISEPMIAVARARVKQEAMPTSFLCADAESYLFEPEAFDTILSRFGVMFFDDPVRAFTNLRGAARDGADLRFVAWRSAAENPFMTAAERAAAPLLPNLNVRRHDEPGQFAFADRGRVNSILEQSGWSEIDIRPIDVVCRLPENRLVDYLTRLGPVGRVLQDVDEPTRTLVTKVVRAAFEPYVHGSEVRYTAACWMVSARS